MKALFSFLAGLVICGPVAAAELSAKPGNYSIEDGRTVVFSDRTIKLRYIAVPSLGTVCLMRNKERDCGLISRSSLLDLSAGASIKCNIDDGGFGQCTAGGFDLAEHIIYTGWAVPIEGAPAHYWRQMKVAIARGHGFWKAKFVQPWTPQEAALKR